MGKKKNYCISKWQTISKKKKKIAEISQLKKQKTKQSRGYVFVSTFSLVKKSAAYCKEFIMWWHTKQGTSADYTTHSKCI